MTIETYTKQLVGNDEGRAVSSVVGIILMIAVSFILAATIATFALDLGQNTAAPQAGFSIDHETGDQYSVTLVSAQRLDAWDVGCGSAPGSLSASADIGSSTSITCSNEDDIMIIGEHNGRESLLN